MPVARLFMYARHIVDSKLFSASKCLLCVNEHLTLSVQSSRLAKPILGLALWCIIVLPESFVSFRSKNQAHLGHPNHKFVFQQSVSENSCTHQSLTVFFLSLVGVQEKESFLSQSVFATVLVVVV